MLEFEPSGDSVACKTKCDLIQLSGAHAAHQITHSTISSTSVLE